MPQTWLKSGLAAAWMVLLAACQPPPAPMPTADEASREPEAATPLGHTHAASGSVVATRHMVVAAHPLAAEAGRAILRAGGNALDAAVAVQLVLTLVEPQSSGLGGGGFVVHFDAKSGAIDTFDGRETAPAAAHPRMFLDASGQPRSFDDVVAGGLSVAVPGLVRMLEMAHRAHGRLPWPRLFEPAIRLAEEGFDTSPRLRGLLARDRHLKTFAASAAYFYAADGRPRARLRNPELAATLRAIAARGADAFYAGPIAEAIVSAVATAPRNPATITLADLVNYRAQKREPVCGRYRVYRICGMAPPSSGGIATLQILGMLEHHALRRLAPLSKDAVHLIVEASRLAYADRNTYVADPDFVAVPTRQLLDRSYLARRAKLISPEKAMGRASAGALDEQARLGLAASDDPLRPSTSHMSIVDADGNAVAFTTTIESAFGSRLFVKGFLLNNQMTDFPFRPPAEGRRFANEIQPGKRPRSSMAPTLVFDRANRLAAVLGSPGGTSIIGYVANALIALLDWNLDPQAAAALPHFANRNGATELERGTSVAVLKPALEAMGHQVALLPMTSGLHIIRIGGGRLVGGADPRREGVALGD